MKGRPTVYVVAVCAIVLAAMLGQRVARGAEANLLLNGSLAKGSGEQPDDWRTEAWVNDPDAFHYTWIHPTDSAAGQLEVDALKPNDARWMQSLTLAPGWYRFSTEVRTENVGTQQTGANISIMEDGAMSPDIRGTSEWQPVSFYLEVGGNGADIELALRVGGFGSLNTGKAFFRNVLAEKLAAPPPGATPVYDLTAIRKAAIPEPVGHPVTLWASFLFLALIALYGWRSYGAEDRVAEAAPASQQKAPQQKAKEKRKAKGRR
jgi:dolichyl-phosphate-mannose-protein mannosyltransferase